ncbi:Ion channel, partial [Oesophagostomum dentatum]
LLLLYIAVASYIIAAIEGWALSDGFYFVMISVLTIGFGDLVPRNETFILVVLLLVLIGLVLTTTCVDIVGAYYIDRLHFFGRRLDDCDYGSVDNSMHSLVWMHSKDTANYFHENLGSAVLAKGGSAEANRGDEEGGDAEAFRDRYCSASYKANK